MLILKVHGSQCLHAAAGKDRSKLREFIGTHHLLLNNSQHRATRWNTASCLSPADQTYSQSLSYRRVCASPPNTENYLSYTSFRSPLIYGFAPNKCRRMNRQISPAAIQLCFITTRKAQREAFQHFWSV